MPKPISFTYKQISSFKEALHKFIQSLSSIDIMHTAATAWCMVKETATAIVYMCGSSYITITKGVSHYTATMAMQPLV